MSVPGNLDQHKRSELHKLTVHIIKIMFSSHVSCCSPLLPCSVPLCIHGHIYSLSLCFRSKYVAFGISLTTITLEYI